jgi:hypothetical protein
MFFPCNYVDASGFAHKVALHKISLKSVDFCAESSLAQKFKLAD